MLIPDETQILNASKNITVEAGTSSTQNLASNIIKDLGLLGNVADS